MPKLKTSSPARGPGKPRSTAGSNGKSRISSTARSTRTEYDQDFRRSVVQMILDGQAPYRIAKDLGLARSMLYRWRDAELTARQSASSLGEKTTQNQPLGVTSADLAAEVARLRRQITVLEQDREILKKAISVVTKPG
jgi:transposase